MNKNIKKSKYPDLCPKNAPIIAGVALLVMTITAIFANFMGIQSLVVEGNAAETVSNLQASLGTFRLVTFAFVVIVLLDVVVAWALYVTFKPTNKHQSLLAGWFRLAYAVIYGASVLKLFDVLYLINDSSLADTFGPEVYNAQVMYSIESFNSGWTAALLLFGVHLAFLSFLIFKSTFTPKWLWIVVLISGLGYIIDSVGKMAMADYGLELSMFTFIGELLLMLWLLVYGWKKVMKK